MAAVVPTRIHPPHNSPQPHLQIQSTGLATPEAYPQALGRVPKAHPVTTLIEVSWAVSESPKGHISAR